MAEESVDQGGQVSTKCPSRTCLWGRGESYVKSPVASLCLLCSSLKYRESVMISVLIFSSPIGPPSALIFPFVCWNWLIADVEAERATSQNGNRNRSSNPRDLNQEIFPSSVSWAVSAQARTDDIRGGVSGAVDTRAVFVGVLLADEVKRESRRKEDPTTREKGNHLTTSQNI